MLCGGWPPRSHRWLAAVAAAAVAAAALVALADLRVLLAVLC